jgi:O-antigen/teichoic acid export membrane protein
VGYVLVSNLIATGIQTLCLFPQIFRFRFSFDGALARKLLRYCFPLMLMGVAGMSNQVVDKIVFPAVYPDPDTAMSELGIYGACFKIAVIMVMFTQAFRYAYEQFVFVKDKEGDNRKTYAAAMKYFLIFSFLAYLAIVFYLDLFRYLIAKDYWEGLRVVGIVMFAEICKGVYFNLSFWYKLTDQTRWGAYFSIIGCVIIVTMNVLLVPHYGYIASAWTSVTGYGVIMLFSYWMGQKRYPIRYDLKDIGKYVLLATLLLLVGSYTPISSTVWRLAFRTLLLLLFVAYTVKHDLPLNQIPVINRFIKKR